jgi:hypothetical protein
MATSPTPKSPDPRPFIPTLVLIAVAALILFSTLGWLYNLAGWLATLFFGALAYHTQQQWRQSGTIGWRVATYPLVGLAISGITPDRVAGAAILIGIGIGFLTLYRDRADRWWAIIPAGLALSLTLPMMIEDGGVGAGLFLLGFAAAFYTLTRLPEQAQTWGVYPAGILAATAILILTRGAGWIAPVALIAAGAWLLSNPDEAKRMRERAANSIRRAATITPEPPAATASSEPADLSPAPAAPPPTNSGTPPSQ